MYLNAIKKTAARARAAIAEINDAVAPSGVNLRAGEGEAGGSGDDSSLDGANELYQPDIIVLLTDGANSQGPLPLDAAQQAGDRQVRVYTIGFGTTDPGDLVCTREQLGGDIFRRGGAFPGGGRFRDSFGAGGDFRRFVVLDEPTLRGMAEMTGGAYFQAENAEQLLAVFLNLPSHIILHTEAREISVLFTALGALFANAGEALSFMWNRFP